MKFRLLPPVTAVESREAAIPILEHLMNRGGHIAIDTETTGLDNFRDNVLFFSMATDTARYCFPKNLLYTFDPLFQRRDITWRLVNAKFDMHMIANHGIHLMGNKWDASVMDVLDDDTRPHGLKEMSWFFYKARWGDFKELFLNPESVARELNMDPATYTAFKKLGVGGKLMHVYDENPELVEDYASCDAYFTYQLCEDLRTRLANTPLPTADMLVRDGAIREGAAFNSLADYYDVIETPMTDCLWRMERRGLPVDRDYAKKIEIPVLDGIARKEVALHKIAGRKLNLSSADQLRELIFGKGKHNFGLKAIKHTASTDKDGKAKASTEEKYLKIMLERITPGSNAELFISGLLEYRTLDKLYGTYIKNLDKSIGPDGRLHYRLKQGGARTGRLACVAEWSPIKTRRGTVRMDDVRVGDEVWTHKRRWRRVSRTIDKGPGQMYDVRFSNGEVLTCTTAHKFLTSDGWHTLEDILEHLEEVDIQQGEPAGGTTPVPGSGLPNAGHHSQGAGDHLSQRAARGEHAHARSREEGDGEAPVLQLQDGVQEPDEGEDWRGAPTLGRRVRRWKRVPHLLVQGEEALRAPRGDDEGVGPERASQEVRGTSHRRGHEEQRAGQLGSRNEQGARHCALPASEGHGVVTIEEVVHRGVCRVLDITVEEDHSYSTCGSFSHNSAGPNIQNIPANDEFKLRGIFCAEPGYELIDLDYPQIEFRIAAVMADEKAMMQAMTDGLDIHCSNAARMYGAKDPNATYEAIMAAKAADETSGVVLSALQRTLLKYRKGSKTVGLATLYGEGVNAIARALKIEASEAAAIKDDFFTTNPNIAALIDFYIDYAYENESTFTTLGRIRRLHRINNPYSRGIQAAEERQAPNTGIQGTGAEMIKLAMLRVTTDEEFAALGAEIDAPIHDELLGQAPEGEPARKALARAKELMADPFRWGPISYTYPVPIVPDAQRGKRWCDLH